MLKAIDTSDQQTGPCSWIEPQQFGKYLLLDRINVGGMAEIFTAMSRNEGFDGILAVKRILPDRVNDQFIQLFVNEAKLAQRLCHPNVIKTYEFGKIDGSYFIVMDYIWGRDVQQLQWQLRRLDEILPHDVAAFVVAEACAGLDYVHNHGLGIVHRDISPQNIMLSFDGQVVIIDFGIARAGGIALNQSIQGKCDYMSPEQANGSHVDRRSDIFSVGILLYELVTGRRLFAGESIFHTLEQVRTVVIPPPSIFRDVPASLEQVIMTALQRDRTARYERASDMRRDLLRFVGESCDHARLGGQMRSLFQTAYQKEQASLGLYISLRSSRIQQQKPEPTEPPPLPPTPTVNSTFTAVPPAEAKRRIPITIEGATTHFEEPMVAQSRLLSLLWCIVGALIATLVYFAIDRFAGG